jgi:energy-coupling factor transport system ATP-binding protein
MNVLQVKINKLGYLNGQVFVKNLFFELKLGDKLYVDGCTGSGKTSILKVISGLIPNVQPADFSGNIKFSGEQINFNEYYKIISFAFQEPENQFLLSNVESELLIFLSESEKKKAHDFIDNFQIRHILKKSVRDISAGQRKIVSLITAMARDSKILILDEPTANLDDVNSLRLFKILKSIKDKIIIIASHDDSLKNSCNKFLIKKNGVWYCSNRSLKSKTDKTKILIRAVPSNEVSISLDSVNYIYPDGTMPFSNLTFTINSGDILSITGKNGTGKTTLLNLITNTIKQPKGKIYRVDNLKISCIFQEPEKQLFGKNVLDEILFQKTKNSEDIGTAVKYLKHVNLGEKIEEHPYFLSRGEKQILLLLSVLLSKPKVLVIDEPFTGLDKTQINKFLNLLSEFYKLQKFTIIMSSQNKIEGVKSSKEIVMKNEKVIIRYRK